VVVHGPPGTGKSQTITNLIADALARNQKVLFVSAKMAALNVVHERLKELGLERFCLEAHSTKAGKMKIIDALRRTLEAETGKQDGALHEELQSLLKLRNELNGYVRELHNRIEPLGLSIYQAIGKLAKLHKAPDIRAPLPQMDALAIDRQRLDDCTDALTQLGTMARVFDARTMHPWRGFTSEKIGLDAQEKIETVLQRLADSGTSMLGYLDLLSVFIPENHQLTIGQLEQFAAALETLAAVDRLPPNWSIRSCEELASSAGIFENASGLALEFAAKEEQLRAYISVPFYEAAGVLSLIDTKFQAWYSPLSPAFWQWRSELKRVCKPGARLNKKTVRAQCAIARRLVEVQRWFDDHASGLTEGAGAAKNAEQLRRTAATFRVAEKLQKALSAAGLKAPSGCQDLTREMRNTATVLRNALPSCNADLKNAIATVETGWPTGFSESLSTGDIPLRGLIARAEEVLSALGRMRDWVLLDRILHKCGTLRLTPFIESLGATSADSATVAFQRRFYTVWTNAAMQKAEPLVEFSGTRRRDLIDKFRMLDAKIRRLAAARAQSVAAQASVRIRSAQDNIGSASEVGILRYELQKKKRVKPLRKLFAEIPHVLQALKPCMLMSPISVSTYLKPGVISFDVVVFDEASQLPTAEAIPSILRAERVIVAGDANQLPSNVVFRGRIDDRRRDGRGE
jgi:hypothetical protein